MTWAVVGELNRLQKGGMGFRSGDTIGVCGREYTAVRQNGEMVKDRPEHGTNDRAGAKGRVLVVGATIDLFRSVRSQWLVLGAGR